MALSIRTDSTRAGGGYALIEGSGLAEVTAISVENCASGQFLGEDGRWKKAPFAFPVETTPAGALSLGPHIVDFVPTELLVALRAQDGKELGRLFWTDVLPSRNPGSVTSAQVFEERKRRIEAKGAADSGRLGEDEARKAAEAAKRAAEEAERQRAAADAEAKRAREAAEANEKTRAEALARQEAAQKEIERKDAERKAGERDGDKRSSGAGRWVLVGLLVLVLGATAAFAFVPGLRDLFKPKRQEEAQVAKPKPPASPTPTPEPPREPVKRPEPVVLKPPPPPPEPARVDCDTTYGKRLKSVRRLTDAEKLSLGRDALRDNCGHAAFDAFDAAAESSEEADWNIARFYDPNETRPVYRYGNRTHADWAAEIYHRWRDRSARQAAALRKICETTNSGGASLRRSCAR